MSVSTTSDTTTAWLFLSFPLAIFYKLVFYLDIHMLYCPLLFTLTITASIY
jgi:hypothetical protein